jgi:hypothetical protein
MRYSVVLMSFIFVAFFILPPALSLSNGVTGAGSSEGIGKDLPPVDDGNYHGDPPYLLEEGWKPLLSGKNLDGWKFQKQDPENGWVVTKGVFWGGPDQPELLKATPEPGDRIVNTAGQGPASNIFTSEKFGNIELYLEFMVPANSNSGVYLQGLYEIQIFDSYQKDLDALDGHITNICGAVYNYARPIRGGIAPVVRAERPPGRWQSLHIWFQAPRFDASAKKISNAKFLRVLLNGVLIHENVERTGPTLAQMEIPEAPENPLMLQGDHGPVAYRNIYVHQLRPFAK